MERFCVLPLLLIVLSLACQGVTPPAIEPTAPASGTILFQDDFSNAATGWDRLQTAQGVMDYDAGGYRMLVTALDTNFWSTPHHRAYRDVRIEVDAGKLGGPDENRVGVVCRLTGQNYYFFLITHDGYYGIGAYLNGQATLIGRSEMAYSPAIHTGVNVNHLRADCIGSELSLFVNGQFVDKVGSAFDEQLGSGDVGLLAGTFGNPGVDMIFDNFVVIQP